ncbi:DUF1307 domain-containing protein [Oceanobacillus jeddahense]|uniref:DUF1307 domain-containing protein n=1 Tax=Oceanobacillus jeddahense TaxID=1462527 RepID=A0ABY5JL89_9BACI|nr:DUF1307 domain-containing protein [Oceanobacillus jeddahense]UUI01063.1 DUF1307 domain-containing protein [Oceanobacillus jeddahense]
MPKMTFRFAGLICLFITMTLLAACGSKEKVTYQADIIGIEMEVALEAKEDTVEKQDIALKLSYELLEVESKEEAEEAIEDNLQDDIPEKMDEANDLKGIKVKTSYEKDQYIQTLSIDYNKIDVEEADSVAIELGFPNLIEDEDDLDFQTIVEDLENEGFTKEE